MSTNARPDFAQLHRKECAALAKQEGNDRYLRAYHLAVSRAAPNGHAPFKRYELAKLLGRDGKVARKGEVVDAIEKAVSSGLLDKQSRPECLLLASLLTGIHTTNERLKNLPCAVHDTGQLTPLRPADCHSDEPHHGHGLCAACYRRERRQAETDGRSPWWDAEPVPFSLTDCSGDLQESC